MFGGRERSGNLLWFQISHIGLIVFGLWDFMAFFLFSSRCPWNYSLICWACVKSYLHWNIGTLLRNSIWTCTIASFFFLYFCIYVTVCSVIIGSKPLWMFQKLSVKETCLNYVAPEWWLGYKLWSWYCLNVIRDQSAIVLLCRPCCFSW